MMGEKLDKEELVKRLQKGLISDEEVRVLMREQLQKRLQWGYKATHEEQLSDLVSFAKSLRKMGVIEEIEGPDLMQYELPIPFYQLVLGDKLKLSVCYFEDDSTTLDGAETAMLVLYCKRAQLMDGQKKFDLGCGYGALTLYIARKYEHCQIAAVTNSKIQTNFILAQCRQYKLSNVEVFLEDVVTFEAKFTFDRVLAIGLIEHMKNYNCFFTKYRTGSQKMDCLFIDHVCHKTFANQYEPVDEDDWFTSYAFPKEAMLVPSASLLLFFQDDLSVEDHWTVSGKHLSLTKYGVGARHLGA